MKILITALFLGAVGALHAQQSSDPPLSSSMKDRMEMGPVQTERIASNAFVSTPQGEFPLSDFRKGGSRQIQASELLGMASAQRETLLSDLAAYNVVAGRVSKAQVDALPVSEQTIVAQNPALFLVKNEMEVKQ